MSLTYFGSGRKHTPICVLDLMTEIGMRFGEQKHKLVYKTGNYGGEAFKIGSDAVHGKSTNNIHEIFNFVMCWYDFNDNNDDNDLIYLIENIYTNSLIVNLQLDNHRNMIKDILKHNLNIEDIIIKGGFI